MSGLERAIDVAPALICPILNAPKIGFIAVDKDDHGAPKMIGKYICVALLS